MCGVLGSINVVLEPEHLASIAHRGPDDRGWETFRVGDHLIRFGHTRLAIQDLSPMGHQPMLKEQMAIVFNGEIYNHLELRALIKNRTFSGHSDTETLIRLLERDGVAALRKLNGIFAFAFVDQTGQRMVLARDPYGVKPLYYSFDELGLVFCSEIKGLTAIVGNTVDRASLALALTYRSNFAPRTIYSRIRKLRPGSYLEIDLSKTRLSVAERSFSFDASIPPASSETHAVAIYRDLFATAIQRQVLADVEVGVFLSGGIDSALVASKLSDTLPYSPKAFTVGFSGGGIADETAEASLTARALGLDHYTVTLGPREFMDTLVNSATIVDEPTATTSIVPMLHLSRLAANHVKVVLSGQGADETSGGYARYRAEVLAGPMVATVARMLLASGLMNTNARAHRLFSYLAEHDERRRYLASHEVFTADQVMRLTGHAVDSAAVVDEVQTASADSPTRMMTYDLRYNLPDDLLQYTDRLTMKFGLECRVPFLDTELVAFLMSLPARYKVNLWGGKRLHRLLASSVLPQSIVSRKKKGFLVPTATWFRTSRMHWDYLLAGGRYFDSLFDRTEVERTLKAHTDGENREKQIMTLMTCCALLERHLEPRT